MQETIELFQPPWLAVAKKEIGQKEIAGPKDNPRIVEYHKATSLKATEDETPWCSSFANWVMLQTKFHGTDSAMARSWLKWGVSLAYPAYGAITVLRRGFNPLQGHVGFFLHFKDNYIALLGGNQGDEVSVDYFDRGLVIDHRWPNAH